MADRPGGRAPGDPRREGAEGEGARPGERESSPGERGSSPGERESSSGDRESSPRDRERDGDVWESGAGRDPGQDAVGERRGDAEARLDAIRARILEVDEALVVLVGERRDLVLEAARHKAALGRPVLDPAREAEVVRRAAELARTRGIDEELVRDVLWRIIASARDAQEGRTRWGPVDAAAEGPPAGPADGREDRPADAADGPAAGSDEVDRG